MATPSLSRPRPARLSEAHSTYLSTAIARYRAKAQHALALAREASAHGNRALAGGLLDEAAAFQAMAQGLAEQSREIVAEITGGSPS